ncbi:MAG: NAD-dependent dehydratase, partial [Thermoleophilia bacterium]
LGLDPETVRLDYAGGDRGWKGDVPVVRLNTDRIQSTGWTCQLRTAEALRSSLLAMADQVRSGNG